MNFSDNGVRFSVKFYVGNHILKFFFELMDVSASKQRRKIQKWPNILNGKITWEIEIVDYLERLSWLDLHFNGILKDIFYSIMTYDQYFFPLFSDLKSFQAHRGHNPRARSSIIMFIYIY